MVRLVGVMLVGLVVIASHGCGGGSPLDTVPVSGTVTLDGTPVEGATVVFAPTAGDGTAATGITDRNGRYLLTTLAPNDGALPGSYMVMISKTEREGGDPAAEAVKPGMTPEEATRAAMEAHMASGQAEAEFVDHLPARYKNPGASGLTAEVARGERKEFDFELTSD